ncbi:hypothetical protein [Acetobacter thailandicus]|uniref:AsmA-like C-terminal domain-containing protein n=1 Tax=Acetobacter thailandicus TaxID=1502842 RepID=A0ABT3QHH3_9PROT|nr:hypothetical protein [Acetobacter thailandicus]MBS0961454.1 hypothetical protein [Acetobacter thailandicus]MBS0981413.1 hypothetical protein [Acetobacter thailandicus]MCX2564728.1 hypothetical protein [Acetobacter thailandicus]NHN96200.1 hypothetical protein [Acetobacter thailandicus]
MKPGTCSKAPLAHGKPDPALLLPPLSELVPSGKLHDGTIMDHGDPEVSNLMQQAGILLAEHSPRLKSTGKAAGEQIGKLASTVMRHSDNVLSDLKTQLADPTKRAGFWARYRKTLLASGAGIIIVCGLGWEVACHEASQIADAKIQGFLQKAGLTSLVKYSSVSASPFGSLTLSDVSVGAFRQGGAPLKISSLSVSGLSSSLNVPKSLSIEAEGIECPVNSLSEYTLGELHGGPFKALGYSALKGDISVSYSLSGQNLKVISSADFSQVGGWNASFALTNVPSQALNNLAQGGAGQGIMLMMQLAGTMSNIQLQSAALTLDNTGLTKRLKAIPDTALPQNVGNIPADVPPFVKWGIEGGRLQIVTQLQQPLPVMQNTYFGGVILNPAFANLNNFIRATQASVSVN